MSFDTKLNIHRDYRSTGCDRIKYDAITFFDFISKSMSTEMKSILVCLAVVLLAHISIGKLNEKIMTRSKEIRIRECTIN